MVVREAIAEYAARDDRLSDAEREEWLRTFAEATRNLPRRPRKKIEAELREVRAARRSGGRLHPVR